MDLTSLLPSRSVEDILAERVRLRVGDGEVYDLPALSYNAVEVWRGALETDLLSMLDSVDIAGDEVSTILTLLSSQMPKLVDALYAYDQTHLLPPREDLLNRVTPMWVLRSVLEVWRSTNPLVDFGIAAGPLAATMSTTEVPSSTPSSSRSRNGVSHRAKSGAG